MEGFFYSATIYLTAAVVAVPLASRLGLGSVLGYLLAGIAIGPVLDIVGSETEDIQHFAEFGVVMMLFLILGLPLVTTRKQTPIDGPCGSAVSAGISGATSEA